MILGRPTNLWLGLVTAVIGLVGLIASGVGQPINAPILSAVTVVAGLVVTLVAYQPPTVNQGDTIKVVTPGSAPNVTKVV